MASERDAQMCIYDASWDNAQFGFCCYIDEQTSIELASEFSFPIMRLIADSLLILLLWLVKVDCLLDFRSFKDYVAGWF